MKLRIGIDLDGTVYPWTIAANDAVMQRFGCSDPGPHTSWDYLKNFLGNDERFAWIWTKQAATQVFGRSDLIFPGAAEVINSLARLGHEIHFVTHRNPQKTGAITARWLNEHFDGYVGVHVLDNSVSKADIYHWHVFIDDKIETLQDFLDKDAAFATVAPNRAWNVELDDPRLTRFDSWGELFDIVGAVSLMAERAAAA